MSTLPFELYMPIQLKGALLLRYHSINEEEEECSGVSPKKKKSSFCHVITT